MYRNRILPTQRKSHDDTQLCKANLRTFYPHNWENSCDDIHAICQFHQSSSDWADKILANLIQPTGYYL